MKKGLLIAGIAVVAVAAVVILTIAFFMPLTKHNNAKTDLQEGRYNEAIAAFAALGD